MKSLLSWVLLVGLLAHQGRVSAFSTTLLSQPKSSRTNNAVQPLASTVVSTIDISETAQRDVYTMEEWASQCGVQKSNGFQLYSEDNGYDYSVVTNEDISAGNPVVYVPNEMLLSSWQSFEEFGPHLQNSEEQLALANLEYLIPTFRLYIKILAEYERGTDSPYYPYLNSLPRHFNNGAAMTYACFECLPPYIAWLSFKERTNSVNFQKAAKFVSCLDETTLSNTNLLKWAYSIAVTRSVDVNGEKVIAPMADMFNHGTETEVEGNFDEQGNYVVYATRDVPAGSPLRVSLGDPTNPSVLFATYGFLDETSPATFCKIMDKRDEMQQLGMDFSNLLFYKDTGDISPEVWDLLLYSILGQDPNLQRGFYDAYVSGDADTKNSYYEQYFPYALEELRNHVDGTLQQLETLSAKARTKDPNTHPRVPVILAHNEFVKSTFLNVKSNLDAM